MNTNKKHLKILSIDDDDGDIVLLNRYLSDIDGYDIELVACNGSVQDCNSDKFSGIDLFFVDYLLEQVTGLDMIAKIREHHPHTPVIMLTGQGNEKIAVKAMKAGISDYIVKSELSSASLARAITTALKQYALEEKVRQQQEQLVLMATQDSLTGLYNRRAFYDRLSTEVDRAKRYNLQLCCLLADIDHFKQVNDIHGHLAGDAALIWFTQIIQNTARNTDVVGRFGGEEFIIGVTNTSFQGAMDLAERIRINIAKETANLSGFGKLKITCSVGVSELRPDDSIGDIINRADQALYKAKKAGRNRVEAMPYEK